MLLSSGMRTIVHVRRIRQCIGVVALEGEGDEDRRLFRADAYGDVDESEDFVLYALPLTFLAVSVTLASFKPLFPNTPISWLLVFASLVLLGGIDLEDKT